MAKFQAPENVDMGGGNWLKEPGTYHAVITNVDEEPKKKNGEILNGFRVTMQVLAGTTEGQENKQVEVMFWNPKLSDKNEGLFARQKQARYLIATGLMSLEDLGKEVDIDLQDSDAKQVILTIETETTDDGKTFTDLSYASIWHVDDPDAAAFPKNEEALALLPKSHRRSPESFKSSDKPAAPKKEPAAAVDLSSL